MQPVEPFFTRMGRVDVFAWNPVRPDGPDGTGSSRLVNNFGDLLGPLLLERMVRPQSMLDPGDAPARSVLMSIGSVMHFAPRRAVVWGSGVNFKVRRPVPPSIATLDIRAVRGPLTARTLAANGVDVPEVFGDPALLLPRFLPDMMVWARLASDDTVFVPNLNDFHTQAPVARELGLKVIDPRAPLTQVLRAIAQSRFVEASSLHAVVVADSLGVPARFVRSEQEHPFKYRDYLAGTGRPLTRVARDIAEALDMGGHEPLDVDLDALLNAFPAELWGGQRHTSSTTNAVFTEREEVRAAWAAVVSEQPINAEAATARFVDDELRVLVDHAQRIVDARIANHDGEDRGGEDDYEHGFRRVRDLRETIAPELLDTDVSDDLRGSLGALDGGDPEMLLRLLWLRRVGPHAIMTGVRAGGSKLALSFVVRPGEVWNDIDSIQVQLRSSGGAGEIKELPVFPLYRRQWSIDLTAVLEPAEMDASAAWEADVILRDSRGTAQTLPIMSLNGRAPSLGGYDSPRNAQPTSITVGDS